MTTYPTLDDKVATLRNAIEGGVKADSMQGLKLMELVDAIGEQFKRELADVAAVAAAVDAQSDESIVEALKAAGFHIEYTAARAEYRVTGWLPNARTLFAALSAGASDAAAGEPITYGYRSPNGYVTTSAEGKAKGWERIALYTHPASEPKAALDADELDEFTRTVEDFEDNGETSTDYDTLMDWAQRGLLECTHFEVTAKAHDIMRGSEQSK